MHLDAVQRPIHPLANTVWNAESDRHPQFPVHGNPLVHAPVVSDHAGPPRQLWHIDDAGVGPAVPPTYDRSHETEQHWDHAQIQPAHGAYAQHHARFDAPIDTFAQAQDGRRSSGKKKAARVPSSFVERQEKLKVSKRKGPLQEKQREKTHTMRKNKRICVRCRFYKSGVCLRLSRKCSKANNVSVMKAIHVRSVRRSQDMHVHSVSHVTENTWKTRASCADVCISNILKYYR